MKMQTGEYGYLWCLTVAAVKRERAGKSSSSSASAASALDAMKHDNAMMTDIQIQCIKTPMPQCPERYHI